MKQILILLFAFGFMAAHGQDTLVTKRGKLIAASSKLDVADTANIRVRPVAGSNMTITGTYPNLTFASSGGGGAVDTLTRNGGVKAIYRATQDSTALALRTSRLQQVFNVLDYGAIGNNSTDNTASFSSCLSAIVTAGGGTMLIPRGAYVGRIVIPPVTSTTYIPIEIKGETPPFMIFGTVGTARFSDSNGVIIRCTATSGVSAIHCMGEGVDSFSNVIVYLKNLDVRVPAAAPINGIDMGNALQMDAENIMISTGIYGPQCATPASNGKTGLITPLINNAALTYLRNVSISGFNTGINVNEHTEAIQTTITSCVNGLDFKTAYHASYFTHPVIQRCTYPIKVSGEHYFIISLLNVEHVGAGQYDGTTSWQQTAYDILDASNLGKGNLFWNSVLGGSGNSATFTKSGGQNISVQRVGSDITQSNDASTNFATGSNSPLNLKNLDATANNMVSLSFLGSTAATAQAYNAGIGATFLRHATNGGADIWFWTRSSADGSISKRMTIKDNGNVGIATTSPTSLLHTSGSFATGYVAKTGTYTAAISDYTIDCTTGTFTVTLPTAVGCTGRIYVIKNSGSGAITVGTTSSQTIDGSTTYSLGTQYKCVTIQSNNANWIVIANN